MVLWLSCFLMTVNNHLGGLKKFIHGILFHPQKWMNMFDSNSAHVSHMRKLIIEKLYHIVHFMKNVNVFNESI